MISDHRHRYRGGTPLLLALLLVGCSASEGPPPPAPPEVTVAVPERRDVTDFGLYTGTVRAVASAEVRARAAGRLEQMHFRPTSFVRKGDPLFTIEPEPYEAARDEAFAALKSAEAELARSESDLDRIELAIQTQAVSEQDLDLARARRDQAEAAVLSARARLERAELDLSYTVVRSPIAGQVGRNLVDVGNLVGQGEPTLLTTVNAVTPIHVYFQVPEGVVLRFLAELRERAGADLTDSRSYERKREELAAMVEIATAADQGFPHRGSVDYVDNAVDPSTGTIEMRAVVDNDPPILFPGLFVRVRLPIERLERALLVAEKAIGTDLGGKFVYVVGDDGIVEQRYVELGPAQDDGTMVVREGLDDGERYIVEGVLRARPGMPVSPTTGSAATTGG